MIPLQKVEKIKMPQNHQVTKIHKKLNIRLVIFVIFYVLEFYWLKITFSSELKNVKYINCKPGAF